MNLADAIAGRPIPAPGLEWLRADHGGSLWTVLSLLNLPAFPFLVLKGRRAPPRERRHAFRFLAGLSVGMLPLVIDVLLTAVPAYAEATRSPARGRAIGMIVSAALLLVPPLTAYAVAGRLFDVRFMIRRVVQYALARYTVIAALSMPTVALAWAIYRATRRTARRRPDAALAAGLAAAGGAGHGAVGPPRAAGHDRPPLLPRTLRRTPHPADAGLGQRARAQPAGAGDAGVGGSRSRAAPATRGAEHPGSGRRRAARSAAASAAAIDRQPAGGAAGRLGRAAGHLARARLAVRTRAAAVGRSPMARGHPCAACWCRSARRPGRCWA